MLRPHIVYMIEYVTLFKINPSGVETVIFWKKGTHTKQKKKKKQLNSIAADVLAPCVARTTAAMVFT